MMTHIKRAHTNTVAQHTQE